MHAFGLSLLFVLPIQKDFHVLENNQNVTAVSFSHDGKWVATAGSEETVRIWDVETKKIAWRLRFGGKDGAPGLECVKKMCFTPDKKVLIIAGGWDTGPPILHFWAMEKQMVRSVKSAVHKQQIYDLCLAPDGSLLVTTDLSGKIMECWNVPKAEPQGTLKMEKMDLSYHSLCRTPEGKTLYFGGSTTLAMMDVETREAMIFGQTGHRGGICSITAHPEAPIVAYAGGDGFTVWANPPKATFKMVKTKGRCTHVQFLPDGKHLAVIRGGTLSLFDETLKEREICSGVQVCDFSGHWAAIGTKSGTILRSMKEP